MDTPTHDFVTVDMRGLKAALVAHAATKRLSVSAVVRGAVARELAASGVDEAPRPMAAEGAEGVEGAGRWVKLSIRIARPDAARLAVGARAAGLSRGAYLAGLASGIPVLASGGSRPETLTALVGSCAELSTLSRNVHQLTSLLREGNVPKALEYREMLDDLTAEVRDHLKQAAGALAALRGHGSPAHVAAPRERQGRRPWRKA